MPVEPLEIKNLGYQDKEHLTVSPQVIYKNKKLKLKSTSASHAAGCSVCNHPGCHKSPEDIYDTDTHKCQCARCRGRI
jgi:hypothetical protein